VSERIYSTCYWNEITVLFQDTKIKVTYRTQNTIQNMAKISLTSKQTNKTNRGEAALSSGMPRLLFEIRRIHRENVQHHI
jgi:hypothetical protein